MQTDLTIGLVQYNTGFRHYLPYSIGILQAYIEAQAPGRYRFLLARCQPQRLSLEAEALAEADLVGFSIYAWNVGRSLKLAALLKQARPEVLIVFGGPQVPDQSQDFLRANAQVDLCVHGEGEAIFAELVRAFEAHGQAADWSLIPSLSWLDPKNDYQQTARAGRSRDLAELPSPYLSGTFDKLMAAWPEIQWSALWESNRGCPFTCSFCDWGSATATKVNRFDMPRLLAELDWFSTHQIDQVFCCDANFGMLKRDLELAQHAVSRRQATGFPVALAVQNAKNVSERTFEIQLLLAQSGLDPYATISFQSLHEPTLLASGRANISLSAFQALHSRLRQHNVHTYSDLILALPEESYDSFVAGYCQLIESGQYHSINVFTVDILPNAPMATPAFLQRYGMETVSVPSVAFNTPVCEDPDGIVEYQQLVIATAAMPRPDWVRTRSFAWLAELLFFKPGLIRVPLMLLHYSDQPLREVLESLSEAGPQTPVLQAVVQEIQAHARRVQQGQTEHYPVRNRQGKLIWKGIYDGVLQGLQQRGQLGLLYAELESLLRPFYQKQGLAQSVLDDALFFSSSFLFLGNQHDLPGLHYQTHWNVWDVYQGLLQAQPVALAPEQVQFSKPWTGAPYRLQQKRLSLASTLDLFGESVSESVDKSLAGSTNLDRDNASR